MILAAIKRFLCRYMTLIEFCKVCGRRVDQVWVADDELWFRLVGTTNGIRCIRCFDKLAEESRIILTWVPKIEHECVRGVGS